MVSPPRKGVGRGMSEAPEERSQAEVYDVLSPVFVEWQRRWFDVVTERGRRRRCRGYRFGTKGVRGIGWHITGKRRLVRDCCEDDLQQNDDEIQEKERRSRRDMV